MKARGSALWTAAAVAAEIVIAVVDVAAGDDTVFTTAFLLPVLALALVARPRDVIGVAALALPLAVLSGVWDDYFLSTDHAVRLVIVAVGVVLAVLSARARAEAEEDRARMALLAEVARMGEEPTLEAALSRLGAATVPAVADLCWVDVVDDEGNSRRMLTRGAAAGAEPAVIPLRVAERTVGELGFAVGPSGRRYDDDDRAFFGVLGGRVALAVANARLRSQLERTRERLDRILGSLAEAVTVHDAAGRTIYANDAARELLGLTPEDALPAEPGALAERFRVTHEDGTPVRLEEFPGRRLVAGEPDPPPMLTRSVRRDTGDEHWLLTKATLLYDEDGAPLAVNVIEDVTEAKESELRRVFLDEAGQVLASSLDYEHALRRVCELAVPALADCAAVDLAGPDGAERVALAHADRGLLALAEELTVRYPPDPDAETGPAAVLRTGTPEWHPTINDEQLAAMARDEEHLRLLRAVGMRASIIVPMAAGDEVIGAMTFVSAQSGRSFDHDDFGFAQDLARRAATAVQNGLLYAEQVRMAQTLQRSLLPERLPDVPGWALGASYEAGDVRAEVGGDFYDIVPTATGHLVVLGDVTGKGVDAAALTALVRYSARTAARFDDRPSALLGFVNSVLRERSQLAPVSLVCALIEGGEGRARVTIASAGHPLPLLRTPHGPPREVGRHDVLLGVVDQARFMEETFEVDAGDVLLFYTDGVTDAPGVAERFGEKRLAAAVASAPLDPSGLLGAVEAAVHTFVAAERADDRAMLALRFLGEPARPAAAPPLAGAEA